MITTQLSKQQKMYNSQRIHRDIGGNLTKVLKTFTESWISKILITLLSWWCHNVNIYKSYISNTLDIYQDFLWLLFESELRGIHLSASMFHCRTVQTFKILNVIQAYTTADPYKQRASFPFFR